MKLLRRTFLVDEAAPATAMLGDRLGAGFWTVQVGCVPPPAHSPSRLLDGFRAEAGMALTLRTDTLLQCDVGPMVSDRLDEFHCGTGELTGLALHEILINAAIHGNLQVASRPSAVWPEREAQARQIAAALADPILAARVVTIALGWHATKLCASIIDEGLGHTPSPPVCDPAATARAASGRGLSIARAAARVEQLCDGRWTRLVFDRAAPRGTS